jgi:hypothetical protein
VTFTDLNNAFKQITGDVNEVFWTVAMKLAWANEAVAAAASKTGSIEKRATILVTAGLGEYALPDDVAFVQRVAYDGEALEPTNQMNLSRNDREWTALLGTPFQFYLDRMNGKVGLYYVPGESTAVSVYSVDFGVWVPTDSTTEFGVFVDLSDATNLPPDFGAFVETVGTTSGKDVEILYTSSATPITAGGTPDLPLWSHGLILFWMLARAYEAETQLQNVGASQLFMHLSEKIIGRLGVRSRGKLPKVWQRHSYYQTDRDYPDVSDRFQYASET